MGPLNWGLGSWKPLHEEALEGPEGLSERGLSGSGRRFRQMGGCAEAGPARSVCPRYARGIGATHHRRLAA